MSVVSVAVADVLSVSVVGKVWVVPKGFVESNVFLSEVGVSDVSVVVADVLSVSVVGKV